MLPRRLRLSRAAFAPSRSSVRAVSPHFSISAEKSLNGGCAVVISKKTAKLSVSRHLLKRRMLTVLRPWCSPSLSLIVYARAGSSALSFRELSQELEELVVRVLGRVR